MSRISSALPEKKIRIRMLCVVLAVLVGFGTVVVSLYKIQITNGEDYQQRAISQQLRSTSITANRGSIYDCNMNTLAASATVWTVLFSPADITDAQAETLADGMSELLGVDRDFIIEKAKNKKNYYQVVKRKVEEETADAVVQFALDNKIAGVTLEPDSKRYYPYGNLASTVLGFVNSDNEGAYGLEAYYNSTLSGTPGKTVTAKNAWGTDMPLKYSEFYDAQDGDSIVLTIDANIQSIVDKHVETAVVEHDVENRACCIVMNVKTGAILAMSTKPDFDPNQPLYIYDSNARAAVEKYAEGTAEYNTALAAAQFKQWTNKAISEPYEPGSVFKIFTVSTGLETGACSLSSTYYCPGYHVVGGVTKHCWKRAGHGSQNLTQAIQNSCNPAFMMIGEAIGPENFYKYFAAYGLNEKTGVDLPGEETGSSHTLETLEKTSEGYLATSAFGQSFKVTPLQLITMISAAVNGGYLYEPYVVSQVLDSDGNVVSVSEPQLKRQVISEETSAIVRQLLEGVVLNGSGRNAQVMGYRIGGKTGTAEKLDTAEEDYVFSFVGIAPIDDPQIAVLLLMDEPYETNTYGSVIAAPVVGSILSELLPYLGVEKEYTAEQQAQMDVDVGYYVGLVPHAAESRAAGVGLSAKILGSGGSVIAQIPAAGTTVAKGSTVMLFTDEASASEKVKVPDVLGKSGLVANTMILNAGLNIKITGVGIDSETVVAAAQSVAAGTEVPRGTVITVDFADTELKESY